MKSREASMEFSYLVIWFLAGDLSLLASLLLALPAMPLLGRLFGPTIGVAGVEHITEDYLLGYYFIPLYGLVKGLIEAWILKAKVGRVKGWVIATLSVWALAWLAICLRLTPLWSVDLPGSKLAGAAAGAILGLALGVIQWRMLEPKLPQAIWWLPVNLVAFGAAGILLVDLSRADTLLLALAIPSVLTGCLLWLPGAGKIGSSNGARTPGPD